MQIAFEQIAEGIDFTEKAKGQVRMALMEACLNIKEAVASDAALDGWVALALDFVKTLPPKDAKPPKKAKTR